MSTPQDGRHDRRSSEGRGAVAGIDDPAGAGEGAEDTRSEGPEANSRKPGAEPGGAEAPPGHDPLPPPPGPMGAGPGPAEPGPGPDPVYGHGVPGGPGVDPFPAPGYGAAPEPHPADPGPEPPYQQHSPPGMWEQPPASWNAEDPGPGYPGHQPDPGMTEPGSPPLPADLAAGYMQQYPAPEMPHYQEDDFGQPGGEFGQPAGEFGQPGGGFGSPGSEFGAGQDQAYGPQGYGPPDQGAPLGPHFEGPPPGPHFEGSPEVDYGAPGEGFGPRGDDFSFPGQGFQQQDTAAEGMPPAPPDVPYPSGAAFPPPHIEADPADLAGLRDRPPPPGEAGGDAPTLVGAEPSVRSAPLGSGRARPGRQPRMPRPQVQAVSRGRSPGRQAQVTVARVEPLSVMKFSFVISIVAFIVLFVAVAVLYGVLAGLGVFDSLQRTIASLTAGQGSNGVNAAQWFSASRVLGYAALFGAANILLITALSTIGAVLYNAAARLIGGVEVTFNETE